MHPLAASTISSTRSFLPYLTTPVHPWIPFGLIDVFGFYRLPGVINWIASGVFDPNHPKGQRSTLLQELFGLCVVLFGGETFLCMCTGQTPSWMLDPKLALFFCTSHTLLTRTPLRKVLPSRPKLAVELPLAIPDAIGRVFLLTRFSLIPLLHPSATTLSLPATPTTLILVPVILAVPSASIIFTATNWFSPKPHLSTPLELRPGGWAYVDTWAPLAVPLLFLSLVAPVKGWPWGFGTRLDEQSAEAVCVLFLSAVFAARAIYNFGYSRDQWVEAFTFGFGSKRKGGKKFKTA
ncbi:hypothetical protein BCR39DRAFT_587910 [Naematelia encephala]|uniref:Uncharacterized protein n=1 Tax=Naematelia encephala TaxID=71784 RepID=A0A1Y2B745_9TREE|nr:hypothetical protein BCR39DRAFT_587910 [Naematelia encephala]